MAQSVVPVATWGLTVGPNEEPEGAFGVNTEPGTLQVTMAAIDPDEEPQSVNDEKPKKPRATLKMIVLKDMGMDSDEDDEDEEDVEMADLLDGEDEDDDEESPNGEGPSDPKKSPKEMKKNALLKALKKDEDDVLAANGQAKGKGKAAADAEADDDEDEDEDDGMPEGAEEYVLCTLDLDNHFNQPLNITIPSHEDVAFRVTGTNSIHLTGNIVVTPADEDDDRLEDPEDEDVDLSPDEDELDLADGDESDELDDMEDPRVTEVRSDEEDETEAPALVKSAKANEKGSKKRPREDDSSMLEADDDKKPTTNGILDKALKNDATTSPQINGETPLGADGKPLSKNQLKKLRKKMKDNAGNAVTVTQTVDDNDEGEKVTTEMKKETPNGKAKSVQFAEELVQDSSAPAEAKQDEKKGVKLENPRVIDGVSVDDRKIGTGPQAKKNDKVSMRYIGKLESDKSVFDSNKKGAPFNFRLGTGQVIKGWDIGVQGMQAGGERRITIPAKHAYGSKKLDKIPANSTLIFDIKLLEIDSKKK
ncbi:MAG: hypothetical protein Q9162_002132 [Coniocarpon cinnabarinum]